MKKINNNYKYKSWEKIILSILSPIFIFLSAPFAIIFAIIFAFIILGIAALLMYSIIKSAAQDD